MLDCTQCSLSKIDYSAGILARASTPASNSMFGISGFNAWYCQLKGINCDKGNNSIIIVGSYGHCQRFRCGKDRPVGSQDSCFESRQNDIQQGGGYAGR